jgi:hypothetical protein
VRRFWPLISFSSVLVVVGAFVLFTISIADPVERAEKESFARGVVVPEEALLRDGPLYAYVALYAGRPELAPETPVDDVLIERDEGFSLRAEEIDGELFYLFVRVEAAATLATYCVVRPLPRMRPVDDGWEIAGTGEEMPELRIEVGRDDACAE